MFPTVPNGLEIKGVCFSERHDFNPVRTQSLNSIALFGAGWIDGLSTKAITHQRMRRSVAEIGKELGGNFQGIPAGRPRILPDGRVGKFGWKAQFATLEEFVAAACANEIGLGTPHMDQAKPLAAGHGQSASAAIGPDLDQTQFHALVAFVTTLPRPQELGPTDPRGRLEVERGKSVFTEVGCAACHTPDLGGVAGVYSDFLLHRIVDNRKNYTEIPTSRPRRSFPCPRNGRRPPCGVSPTVRPTSTTAPQPTLDAAILRHEADAQTVTEAYRKLSAGDRAVLLLFLGSLKAPADAETAPAGTRWRGDNWL